MLSESLIVDDLTALDSTPSSTSPARICRRCVRSVVTDAREPTSDAIEAASGGAASSLFWLTVCASAKRRSQELRRPKNSISASADLMLRAPHVDRSARRPQAHAHPNGEKFESSHQPFRSIPPAGFEAASAGWKRFAAAVFRRALTPSCSAFLNSSSFCRWLSSIASDSSMEAQSLQSESRLCAS